MMIWTLEITTLKAPILNSFFSMITEIQAALFKTGEFKKKITRQYTKLKKMV